jgi:hypothetical protein
MAEFVLDCKLGKVKIGGRSKWSEPVCPLGNISIRLRICQAGEVIAQSDDLIGIVAYRVI